MIAAVDIGNTRTKFALFSEEGKILSHSQCASTAVDVPESFFKRATHAMIGSVVPKMLPVWKDFFSCPVHIANSQSPWGFKIKVEEPEKIGVDRLLNLEAAIQQPGAILVVDAGTATKFDLLEGAQERIFPGGAIAPGVEISFRALIAHAAQLPEIELRKHSPVLGYNTETAIRSGVVHGFAAQVDGMILKIFEERGLSSIAAVIGTGGNIDLCKGRARLITNYRPHLTLEGLYALSRKVI